MLFFGIFAVLVAILWELRAIRQAIEKRKF
jgi:hypothetical protein